MFTEPAKTPLDLRFRLFGIPIRVTPMFWLFSALFGWSQVQFGYLFVFLWVVCTFLSVLLHEMGHVLIGRLCRQPGHIVLLAFGGLAIGQYQYMKRWQRVLLSFAGPAANFLLFGAAYLFSHLVVDAIDPARNLIWLRRSLQEYLPIINLFLGCLNLLPIYPLDGGQISREVCTGVLGHAGLRLSLGLSFLLAGLIAVYAGFVMSQPDLPWPTVRGTLMEVSLPPLFAIFTFGMLAFQSFAALIAAEREHRRSQWEEEPETW